MNFLPVITRELRAQARQPLTYWLRTLGLLGLLIGSLFLVGEDLLEANLGGRLFGVMHCICYASLWIFVPLSAADCLSRERREGTLGLLFLTHLKPPHIVIAKSIAHSMRAWTLIIAVVPAMTIPFLLGGVTWQQAVLALFVNFNAVCWCLAATLVASALTRSTTRAMILAIVLAAAGFLFFSWLIGALLGINSQTTWTGGYSQTAYDFVVGVTITTMPRAEIIAALTRFIKASQLVWTFGLATFCSLAALAFSVMFAGNRISHSWRDEPPSQRVQKVERAFCEPIIGVRLLRRWMLYKLEHNPIGWLGQRSWSGRLVTWGWLAVMISIVSMALTDQNYFRNGDEIYAFIGWLLSFSMVAVAAGSFRRERATGVMELLLVAPLKTEEIILGRLRGLWGQFLPATVLLLGVWVYLENLFPSNRAYIDNSWEMIIIFGINFLIVPVAGLYFSVRCRYFITALLFASLMAFALPAVFSAAIGFLEWFSKTGRSSPALELAKVERTVFFQLLIGVFLWHRLYQKLERRTFPLERPAS